MRCFVLFDYVNSHVSKNIFPAVVAPQIHDLMPLRGFGDNAREASTQFCGSEAGVRARIVLEPCGVPKTHQFSMTTEYESED